MSSARQVLGRRLAERRATLGLSLDAVAEHAQATPSYLHYVEQGALIPPASRLNQLADAYRLDRAELATLREQAEAARAPAWRPPWPRKPRG